MEQKDTYIYIQEFDDGDIRYGITNNLDSRMRDHRRNFGDCFSWSLMVDRAVKLSTAKTIEALLIQQAFDNDVPCKNNHVENKRYLFENKDNLEACPICEEIGCSIDASYINGLIKEHREKRKEQKKAYYEANKEKISERKRAYYEANKERRKAYHEANKEQIKEQLKAYYEANKERINEQMKAYYEANKERKKEQMKAYYEANKEQVKAYYEANKEKIKEQKKAYYEANKERINEQKKVRYMLKIGLYNKTRNQFWRGESYE